MNEKDRLVERIEQSGIICDNCPDYDCSWWAEHCADYLITHNVTVPPVSVGQTVYIIRRPKGLLPWIAECTVGEIHVEYTADGKVCWFKSHNYEALEEDIGHWVFLTREEAEQALKERRKTRETGRTPAAAPQ